MKHILTRIRNFADKPVVFVTTLTVCLAVDGTILYLVLRNFDLHTSAARTGYYLGLMVSLTCLTLAVLLVGIIQGIIQLILGRREPLPIDPDYPPTRLIYIRGTGEPERCYCHNEPIADGREIWHWPQPAKLLCIEEHNDK